MIRKIFTLLMFLSLASTKLQANNCYSEYWQNLFWTMWQNDTFRIATYVKLETDNHLKDLRYFQLNEQFRFKATKNLTFEVHYAYIHDRHIIPKSPWTWQHRGEFEANYATKISAYQLETRNRLEVRNIQNDREIRFRFRQRTMLIFPFENEGSLKSFSVFNELFYDLTHRLFTQDRVCPFQVTFALTEKVDMDIFFMVRFFESNQMWNKSAVFGTELNF